MITPMKKVMLAGRHPDRDAVLDLLRETGVVHVEPVHPELVQVSPELLQQIEQAAKAVETLGQFTPAAAPAAPDAAAPVLAERVQAQARRLAALRDEKQGLEQEMLQVAPWGQLGKAELAALAAGGLQIQFFTCPRDREASITAELYHIVTRKDGVSYGVAVSRQAIVLGDAVTPVATPERDSEELQTVMQELNEEESTIRSTLNGLALQRETIQAHLDELEERKRFSEVELSLLHDGPIFVLQGWVPEPLAANLKQAIEATDLQTGMRLSDPEEEDLPPTKLQNSWWCRPIECLYSVLGITPGYQETDISPFFLPFLTVFTAMIFADAGYGLTALLALVVVYKPLTAKGFRKDLLQLFMILFSGVVIYGLLTNAYFGTSFIKLTSFNAANTADQDMLIKLCFFIGALHISIAHLWKIRRKGIALTALAEVGWVCFSWGVYALVNVLVLSEPEPPWMIPLFWVALALILFFTAPSRNIFLAVAKGLGAIALSATGFLSDIISYIRLWAVGLAGGILAARFNALASPLPLVMAAVILMAGHLMNMALCTVAIFAHGVRLNLLEFSNHIGMEWSGREYDPFTRKNRAVY